MCVALFDTNFTKLLEIAMLKQGWYVLSIKSFSCETSKDPDGDKESNGNEDQVPGYKYSSW